MFGIVSLLYEPDPKELCKNIAVKALGFIGIMGNLLLIWISVNIINFHVTPVVLHRLELEQKGSEIVLVPTFIVDEEAKPIETSTIIERVVIEPSHHLSIANISYRGSTISYETKDDKILVELNERVKPDTEISIEVKMKEGYRDKSLHTRPYVFIEIHERVRFVPIFRVKLQYRVE